MTFPSLSTVTGASEQADEFHVVLDDQHAVLVLQFEQAIRR